MQLALVVLAAGQGTRMNSDLPKVLHEVGNLPLFAHALSLGAKLEADRSVLVLGHGADQVRSKSEDLGEAASIVIQSEQRGTGHAVACAGEALHDFDGDVLVLFGDTPFIRPQTIETMLAKRAGADIVVLGFEAEDPARYGRFVTAGEQLVKIVEFKDAKPEERSITLCNSGVLLANRSVLFDLIGQLDDNNASGELYLTDVVALGQKQGLSAGFVKCKEAETLGINSRQDLARAERVFQDDKRREALENGVTLLDPSSTFFSYDTYLGRDSTVEQNVVFGPGVTVETGARIRAFSHIEGAHVGADTIVGPFARLRPGTELSNKVRIGNFVETKNARIGEGSKVNHLSYIGDTDMGDAVNVGAGTVTCNYDGTFKHKTTIGDRAFIGSDTMLVAPVTIGADTMTASGSVITKDVPDSALAIARQRQENKPGLAVMIRERLKTMKQKAKKDS